MKKALPVIIVVLIGIAAAIIWQKSQVKPSSITPATQTATIKKVDLATQPEWIQKLTVTAKKGVSPNGLANVTITASGMPAGLVQSFDYVIQYQTTNKGTQGALSTRSIGVSGSSTTLTKTIDLGTCSTKTCVRHDGVTSVDIELDFATSSGQFTWTGTIALK